jgi:hypothetical protein
LTHPVWPMQMVMTRVCGVRYFSVPKRPPDPMFLEGGRPFGSNRHETHGLVPTDEKPVYRY